MDVRCFSRSSLLAAAMCAQQDRRCAAYVLHARACQKTQRSLADEKIKHEAFLSSTIQALASIALIAATRCVCRETRFVNQACLGEVVGHVAFSQPDQHGRVCPLPSPTIAALPHAIGRTK